MPILFLTGEPLSDGRLAVRFSAELKCFLCNILISEFPEDVWYYDTSKLTCYETNVLEINL